MASFAGRDDWRILRPSDVPVETTDLEGWLHREEALGRRILMVCEDPNTHSEWLTVAMGNCDSAMLCAPMLPDGSQPQMLAAKDAPFLQASRETSTHLLIYREATPTPITGTAAWLTHHDVGLHHHLALDNGGDFARVGRFIRGEAIGLVLSGGGAFGAAHIGALKALQERGFVFDMVGGTSIGSAMAAIIGLGLPPEEGVAISQEMFVKKKSMGRLTFPLYSMLDHHRFDSQLQKHCRGLNVEDMPLNFFSLAANLRDNSVKLMRRGPLWQAIRASSALPGVLPPFVNSAGDVLIDGGLLDNVPITQMRRIKSGPNLILNFNHGGQWQVTARYSSLPGRLGALARFLGLQKMPKPRFPIISSILARSMVVSARQLMDRTDLGSDALVELKTLPGMGFLEWSKSKKQFDASYAEISQLLDDLQIQQASHNPAEQIDQLSRIGAHLSDPMAT